jgi:hypothetical protein
MFGNLNLRLAENDLKMTDAKRRSGKKMENAQPGAIAKTLIDLDQIHGDLTTSRGCRTAGSCGFGIAALTRSTLRPASAQDQI